MHLIITMKVIKDTKRTRALMLRKFSNNYVSLSSKMNSAGSYGTYQTNAIRFPFILC